MSFMTAVASWDWGKGLAMLNNSGSGGMTWEKALIAWRPDARVNAIIRI